MTKLFLEDVMSDQGITYGVVKPEEHDPNGIPLIKAADVSNGSVNLKTSHRITQEKHIEHRRTELQGGEILLTLVGTPGMCAIAPKEAKGCNVVRAVGVFDVLPLHDNRFVMYSLHSKASQHYIRNVCNTTVQATLNLGDVRKLPLSLPPLQEQKAIAHILGTLDEKIELNQKTNETIEGIAKALFKSWFIDFDPVRAKAEGRSTGLPNEISELFQDSFEDSELGEIPSGWRIQNLPDIFDFLEGPGIRHWQYTNDQTGIKFINIRCIKDGDLNVDTANRITEEEASGKYKHFALSENDIVVSTSGTLGRYAVVRKEHLPLNLNTSVIRFRPKKDISTFPFLLGFIQNQLQHELEIRASGSVQRNFGPMHLRQINLLLPSINLLKTHEISIQNLYKKRALNLRETNLLIDLRDTLLPKLISGELRVPDAEKMLEEVGI